jgi:8-oxo-dGTP diphosphatase
VSVAVARRGRQPITVVAAVIEQGGLVLIGQRRLDDRHGGRWEFPGGKLESHEEPRAALARELKEELGIEAEVDREITRYEYQYPGRPPIHLIFYRVGRWQGEPRSLAFERIEWVSPQRFPEYDFLDGDIDFVRRLARGEL